MHSSKVSIIIAAVIIAINICLLIVYFGKQGKHTFSFIESLYKEIRANQTSVSVRFPLSHLLGMGIARYQIQCFSGIHDAVSAKFVRILRLRCCGEYEFA